MRWVEDDGGRAAAGFRGSAGDCVTRAIAIATGEPYRVIYAGLFDAYREVTGKASGVSPRNGVPRRVYGPFLRERGWVWTPTMRIGTGCTVHLRSDELPSGRLIARLSHHLVAVIDGVVRDTFDPSREGTRCVYGYYRKEGEPS